MEIAIAIVAAVLGALIATVVTRRTSKRGGEQLEGLATMMRKQMAAETDARIEAMRQQMAREADETRQRLAREADIRERQEAERRAADAEQRRAEAELREKLAAEQRQQMVREAELREQLAAEQRQQMAKEAEAMRKRMQEESEAMMKRMAEEAEETRQRLTREADVREQQEAERRAADAEQRRAEAELGKKRVESVVAPVRAELERLQQTLDRTKEEQVRMGATFQSGMRGIMEREGELHEAARQLAEALKNRGKVQGDWGEQVLEDILRNSGLREGVEFYRQPNHRAGSADLRPDIVVCMPDGGKVVIDSKVSLTAWAEYCAAQSEDERTEAARANLRSVESHVKELARKEYHKVVDGAAPTVIMFVPNEGSYLLALNTKPDLLTEAFGRDVLIVNPTNLMLTLRLILVSWRSTRQQENCQAVINAAGALTGKLATFIEEHAKLGDKIQTLQNAYEQNARRLGSTRSDSIASRLTAIANMDVSALNKEMPELT